MSACPKVVNIAKRKAGEEPVTERASPANQLLDTTAKLNRMQKEALDVSTQQFFVCHEFSSAFFIPVSPQRRCHGLTHLPRKQADVICY